MISPAERKSDWLRSKAGKIRKRWKILLTVVVLLALLSQCSITKSLIESSRKPDAPFAQTKAPPAPDYAQMGAWFALPGANGLERSAPPGFTAIDERVAPADVFFIHPTMYLKNDVWNAPYDVEGAYNGPVLLAQLSAFNGCCLLYAPHYRQASLAGLANGDAVAFAYADVARAFRYYIEHYNRGRPFIIASHSQGTGHAVRLLQEAIVGTPLQDRLVAAYTIGAYTPASFASIGLPTCNDARQTGCVMSWNASQEDRTAASMLTKDVDFWWQGKRVKSTAPAICVNPLTWTEKGTANASANKGSLPFPEAPYPEQAAALAPLEKGLTGARCNDMLLDVDVAWRSPFRDTLSWLYGSYHRNDYGLFYASIRANAIDRVASWKVRHPD
ncbi:DUF3089 domain-containing protein [Sphingopyxis macrogoltabida]|uniref:DUF3089 domain-containing protein n=1 Tax=Sphingopyxis macrogoltabida TaxID=33050 RepID=A0A0N9VET5_SPHMC|nr:DUF3089 domain-containing protein [Sphingopyxis macrogoltabida]ALH82858.1 hypothetical protein AN936_21595 [Sphingopyxis macrogoltabida]